MKKVLTVTFLTLSSLLILDSMDAFHALTMLLLAGIIPGTDIALSATVMLQFFALLLGFVLARISVYVVRLIAQQQTARVATLRME